MRSAHRLAVLSGTLVPWVFVLVGLLARLLWLEDIEFKRDEFQALTLGHGMTCGQGVLAGMPSSQGLIQPPLFLHLVAIATLLSSDAVVITSLVAVVNCAAIVSIPWGFRSSVGKSWSVWLAAIMATSPWPVMFSRKLWTQDLLFPAMVLFWSAWMSNRRSPAAWKVVFAALGLVAASQLHLTGAFASVGIVLCIALFDRRLLVRDVAILVAITLVMYIPFALFHVADRGRNLSHAISTASDAQPEVLDNVRLSIVTSTSSGYERLLGDWVYARLRPIELVAMPWSVLLVCTGVVGCALEVRNYVRAIRANRRPAARTELCLLLVAGFATNEWLLMFLGAPAAPHYHIACWPCLAVGCVLWCRRMSIACQGRWRFVSRLALTGMCVSQSVVALSLISAIHMWPTRLTGDYGIPYSQAKAHWTAAIRVACEQNKSR